MKEYLLIGELYHFSSEGVEIRETVILTKDIKNITECDVSIFFKDDEREEVDNLNVDSSKSSCITLIGGKKIYVLGSPSDIFKQMYS